MCDGNESSIFIMIINVHLFIQNKKIKFRCVSLVPREKEKQTHNNKNTQNKKLVYNMGRN